MNKKVSLKRWHVAGLFQDCAGVVPGRSFYGFALALALLTHPAGAAPATNTPSAGRVAPKQDLGRFRRTVETLRGKEFLRPVPVFDISEEELRRIVDRELEKDYPGAELTNYQALMIWLDMLPPGTDLRAVSAAFFVDQVAGFYDSDSKEMCIPSFSGGKTNVWRNVAKKKVERFSDFTDGLVFDHEYTHALEDQYWPFDEPEGKTRRESTDRSTARSFLAEGSATRIMVEAVPAEAEEESPGAYPTLWNVIHSGAVELVLEMALNHVWKSSEVLVPGVPATLVRSETMPYAYGYRFCSKLMRNWGLDGLDYMCGHPPVSTAQVIHPQKAWEWRDFPVQITLPESLPGGWKQLTGESLGEAGISVLLGCSSQNLNRGERLACGWDGDRAALYESSNGERLMVWASSWDSTATARRFADTWLKERQALHKASISGRSDNQAEWSQPNGRAGALTRNGKQLIIFEADRPQTLDDRAVWAKSMTFTEPREDAVRDAANHALLRVNPLFSWRRDGDYTVSKTLWGILSRHDRNGVGAADRVALGLVGESHRTESFHKWEMGWSLVAKHQSDARRGVTKTAVLPWGVLFSRLSARLPQDPAHTVSRVSVLWGVAGSRTRDSANKVTFEILPAGLLLRSESSPVRSALHVLGTGVARTAPTAPGGGTTRFRLLGIPLWTAHSSPKQPLGIL